VSAADGTAGMGIRSRAQPPCPTAGPVRRAAHMRSAVLAAIIASIVLAHTEGHAQVMTPTVQSQAEEQRVIAAEDEMAMVGQKIRERSVLVEGDIALVFGTAELRFADPGKDDVVQSLRYTSTYVKRQGQWRMLALQMQQRAPAPA